MLALFPLWEVISLSVTWPLQQEEKNAERKQETEKVRMINKDKEMGRKRQTERERGESTDKQVQPWYAMKGHKRKDTWMTQSEGRQGTCAWSIITGVHFGEVSIDRGLLGWVISAVQTAVAHAIQITGVCSQKQHTIFSQLEKLPQFIQEQIYKDH